MSPCVGRRWTLTGFKEEEEEKAKEEDKEEEEEKEEDKEEEEKAAEAGSYWRNQSAHSDAFLVAFRPQARGIPCSLPAAHINAATVA